MVLIAASVLDGNPDTEDIYRIGVVCLTCAWDLYD